MESTWNISSLNLKISSVSSRALDVILLCNTNINPVKCSLLTQLYISRTVDNFKGSIPQKMTRSWRRKFVKSKRSHFHTKRCRILIKEKQKRTFPYQEQTEAVYCCKQLLTQQWIYISLLHPCLWQLFTAANSCLHSSKYLHSSNRQLFTAFVAQLQ